jgi:hypothetical protein
MKNINEIRTIEKLKLLKEPNLPVSQLLVDFVKELSIFNNPEEIVKEILEILKFKYSEQIKEKKDESNINQLKINF